MEENKNVIEEKPNITISVPDSYNIDPDQNKKNKEEG